MEVENPKGEAEVRLRSMEAEPNLWMIHEQCDLSEEKPPQLHDLCR